MQQIWTVVGARPQFVKAAMLSRALARFGIRETLIHTGQHYDDRMSRIFFDELKLPRPAHNLEVGSGSHAEQTGAILIRLEETFRNTSIRPDALLVYGDTNSTLAAALFAAKIKWPLIHVEAGLRSFNRQMPEEVNRVVTDRLANLLFCPSRWAVDQLQKEGITRGVHFTGDIMYDALRFYKHQALRAYHVEQFIPFEKGSYILVTIHRPHNTDTPERVRQLVEILGRLEYPVVWPLHPRMQDRLEAFKVQIPQHIHVTKPVGYLTMLSLLDGAYRVLTDSGGLQKEAYWMERPCLTLRPETEWTETLVANWNQLVTLDLKPLKEAIQTEPSSPISFPYGKGRSAEVMAGILQGF